MVSGFGLISRKVNHEVHVEVTSITIREFETNYLSENGRRIEIIGQISVKNSVQFLVLYDQSQGSGLLFICNLRTRVEATGWGSGNYYNQDWEGRLNDAKIMKMSLWVLLLNLFRLTCRGVLLSHAPPDAVSAKTSLVAGTKSVCGTNTNSSIPWSIPGFIACDKTGMVRLLNYFFQNPRY